MCTLLAPATVCVAVAHALGWGYGSRGLLFLSLDVECSKHDSFNFAYSTGDNLKPLCWNCCTVSFWLTVTFESFLNDDWCHEIPSAKNQHVVHNQNGWRICFMLWPILVSSLGGNVLPPMSHPAHSLFLCVGFLWA